MCYQFWYEIQHYTRIHVHLRLWLFEVNILTLFHYAPPARIYFDSMFLIYLVVASDVQMSFVFVLIINGVNSFMHFYLQNIRVSTEMLPTQKIRRVVHESIQNSHYWTNQIISPYLISPLVLSQEGLGGGGGAVVWKVLIRVKRGT